MPDALLSAIAAPSVNTTLLYPLGVGRQDSVLTYAAALFLVGSVSVGLTYMSPFYDKSDLYNFTIGKQGMVDKTNSELATQRNPKLANAGISADMLTNAANAAARLCAQSGIADGGALNPCHSADYQQLLHEQARKASS